MQFNSLLELTSISQWSLFLGIALIIFGFIETKENFILIGQIVFIILGFFGLYIILSNSIAIPETDQIKIPKELKVLTFFKSVVLFLIFTTVSAIMSFFKIRYWKISVYITTLLALALFFIIVNIMQLPN